jgi:hypothetical protein
LIDGIKIELKMRVGKLSRLPDMVSKLNRLDTKSNPSRK